MYLHAFVGEAQPSRFRLRAQTFAQIQLIFQLANVYPDSRQASMGRSSFACQIVILTASCQITGERLLKYQPTLGNWAHGERCSTDFAS